ncbi:unnamed protein product [Polarella glacialis]|uniref:Glycoside hydrolase family 5 domain-containing protein n=1 Tax=Polarella glacialis TaxID=89957 RepID=A0A813H076_POLGL|nr:unnamed protein product [Polarella glacialis]
MTYAKHRRLRKQREKAQEAQLRAQEEARVRAHEVHFRAQEAHIRAQVQEPEQPKPKPAVQLPIPVAVRPAAAAATGYEEDISRALTSPPSMPRCHTPNRTSQEWRPDPKAQINRIVGEVKVLGSCPGSVNTRPLKSHELQRDVSRSRASAEEPPVAAHLQVHQARGKALEPLGREPVALVGVVLEQAELVDALASGECAVERAALPLATRGRCQEGLKGGSPPAVLAGNAAGEGQAARALMEKGFGKYSQEYPEEAWLSSLRAMARRYRHEEFVIGYDLRNEPRPAPSGTKSYRRPHWSQLGGSNDTDWAAAALRGGLAVASEDSDALVVVEGLDFATDLSGLRAQLPSTPLHRVPQLQGRVVYEVHDYCWYHPELLQAWYLHWLCIGWSLVLLWEFWKAGRRRLSKVAVINVLAVNPAASLGCRGSIWPSGQAPVRLLLGLVLLFALLSRWLTSYGHFAAVLEEKWGFLLSQNEAPVWLGEFGTNGFWVTADWWMEVGEVVWWSHITRYLREQQMDYAYWALNGDKGAEVIANSASAITFRAPSMESASDLNSFRGGDMQRSSSAFSAVRAHSPRSSGFRSPVLTPAGSVRSMSSRGYATPSRGGVAGPPSSGGYMSARPSSQPSAAPQATAVVVPQWAWQAPSAASGGARAPVVATVVPHKNLLTNSSQDVLAQLVTPSRAVRRAPVQELPAAAQRFVASPPAAAVSSYVPPASSYVPPYVARSGIASPAHPPPAAAMAAMQPRSTPSKAMLPWQPRHGNLVNSSPSASRCNSPVRAYVA